MKNEERVCQRVGCEDTYLLTVPWRKYCDTHKTQPGPINTYCPNCQQAIRIEGTMPVLVA